MAQIETWFDQDLKKPVKVHHIPGNVFTQDNDGNLIGVRVYDHGEAVTLSGSVSANVIRPDGGTVAVSGSLSGNTASVELPQAAYAYPGMIAVIIKLTSDSVITTLCAVTAIVYRSSTDVTIDPGTIVPSIQALIADIDAAVDSIPPEYSELVGEVSDLKSAFDKTEDYGLGFFPITWEQGNVTSSGESSSTKFIRSTGLYPAVTGETIEYNVASGYTLRTLGYNSSGTYKGGLGDVTGKGNLKIAIADVAQVRFRINKSDSTAVVPSEGYDAVSVVLLGKGTAFNYANFVAKNDTMAVYWEQGNVNTSGESTSSANIRSIDYISTGMIGSIKAVLDNTVYQTTIIEYDSTKTAIRSNPLSDGKQKWLHPNTAYIRIKINHADASAITPNEGTNVSYKVCSGRLPYAIPQMFGAVGDGVTDDTEAFRTALNSGYDICVPFSSHEVYLITGMVTISKPQTGSQTKRLYGDGGQNGYIYYDVQQGYPEDDFNGLRSRSLFRITDTQAFTFDNLNVRANTATIDGVTKRVGGFLRANDNETCDYDIKIRNCNITKFYRFIAFKGRGFTVENCAITSMQTIGTFDWDDAYDTNANHPANMDQRAIIFKGNRLHSIQSGGISVRSGHAYGLVFTDNVMDVGRKYVLISYDEAWNWTIANNTFLGYCDNVPVFEFKDGAKNLIMTGNQCISDSYFWISTPGNPTNWLLSQGVITGSCIASNIFKSSKDSLIHVKGLLATTICNNILTNPGHVVGTNEDSAGSGEQDDDGDNPYHEDDYIYDDVEQDDDESGEGETETGTGCIYIEDTIQNSAIIGNIATYSNGSGHLLELGTGATQSNVIVEHNIT